MSDNKKNQKTIFDMAQESPVILTRDSKKYVLVSEAKMNQMKETKLQLEEMLKSLNSNLTITSTQKEINNMVNNKNLIVQKIGKETYDQLLKSLIDFETQKKGKNNA